MLKITIDAENFDIIRVNLCGRFTSEYIPEVEKALDRNGDKAKKYALDLTDVTFVDRAAMEFLRAIKSQRIRVENLPSYVTRWIKQEAGNSLGSSRPRNK